MLNIDFLIGSEAPSGLSNKAGRVGFDYKS